MRRTALIALTALAALAAVPVAGAGVQQASTPLTVKVSPATGGPRTTFMLSFRGPSQIGILGSAQRVDTVQVSGPHRAGCVWSGQMALPSAASLLLVRVALTPARLAQNRFRQWCTGTFHGSIMQSIRFTCGPPQDVVCPLLEIRPQTIATFSFRVARRS